MPVRQSLVWVGGMWIYRPTSVGMPLHLHFEAFQRFEQKLTKADQHLFEFWEKKVFVV